MFGFLLEIIILSVAMFIRVKKYLFANLQKGLPEVQTRVIETGTKKKVVEEEVLSKREMEILTAFPRALPVRISVMRCLEARILSERTLRIFIRSSKSAVKLKP